MFAESAVTGAAVVGADGRGLDDGANAGTDALIGVTSARHLPYRNAQANRPPTTRMVRTIVSVGLDAAASTGKPLPHMAQVRAVVRTGVPQ